MNLKLAQHKLSRRIKFNGLDISIETDKGEYRHWYDPHNKTSGKTLMKYPYGYIRRTEGTDGDHVDVYVGPDETAPNVYIVNQMKAPDFKKFDEQKCMLGFTSTDAAKKAYLAHYDDNRFLGAMTTMSFEQFKKKALDTFEEPKKIASYAHQRGQTAALQTLGLMKLARRGETKKHFLRDYIPAALLGGSLPQILTAGLVHGTQALENKLTPSDLNREKLFETLKTPLNIGPHVSLDLDPFIRTPHWDYVSNRVRGPSRITPGLLAHEMGHASGHHVPWKLYQAGKGFGPLSGLIAAPFLYNVDPDSAAATALTYGPSAAMLPMIAEEARAHIRGNIGLRRAGLKNLANKGLLSQIPALLTYGSYVAAPALTAQWIRHKERQRSRFI